MITACPPERLYVSTRAEHGTLPHADRVEAKDAGSNFEGKELFMKDFKRIGLCLVGMLIAGALWAGAAAAEAPEFGRCLHAENSSSSKELTAPEKGRSWKC